MFNLGLKRNPFIFQSKCAIRGVTIRAKHTEVSTNADVVIIGAAFYNKFITNEWRQENHVTNIHFRWWQCRLLYFIPIGEAWNPDGAIRTPSHNIRNNMAYERIDVANSCKRCGHSVNARLTQRPEPMHIAPRKVRSYIPQIAESGQRYRPGYTRQHRIQSGLD